MDLAPSNKSSLFPTTPIEWRAALSELPDIAPSKPLPVFYFAHGSPMFVRGMKHPTIPQLDEFGPDSIHAQFLADFGTTLTDKYKPKGIVVFSAHWETDEPTLVTDYGDENPLLYDLYGFSSEMYQLQFKSKGSSVLSNRVVEVLNSNGQAARTTPRTETRGRDGRGYKGPVLDHGVSLNTSLDPEDEWALGAVVAELRDEDLLVLSGGLTIHNISAYSPSDGDQGGDELYRAFDRACLDAVTVADPVERKYALLSLTHHHGFRSAHPREDHFVPLYIAAGAGGDGAVKVLQANYSVHTYAFGL